MSKGVWGKIKTGWNTTTEKAGLETSYLRAKSKGFQHTHEVEPHINVLRKNREEIPKLYEQISGTEKHIKKLADDDKTLSDSLAVYGDNETDNEGLKQFMLMYSEFLQSLSGLRFTLDALFEQVKADMHMIAKDDLKEIRKVHDHTNRHLTDSQFWYKKGDKAHLTASQSKYKEFAAQLITLIQAHRESKEANLSGFLLTLMKAQMQFFDEAAKVSQQYHERMSNLPPVQVRKFEGLPPNFDPRPGPLHNESGEGAGAAPTGPAAGQQTQAAPPPVSHAPTTAPPPSLAKQARAMYDFAAENPQELSFKTGDVLAIHESQGEWWVAELNGNRGFIPANYVTLIS